MEPLLKQLRELPAKFTALPPMLRYALIGGAVLLIAIAAAVGLGGVGSDSYQYAFTNLTAEDSAEAAQTLKNAGIPFRLEAGGAALAVPAAKVYDARLLLASAGLPKGGGVGFELFDRGDLGVSEFTQKVNLRRAIEGEVARTISRLAAVRSARVHVTLGEKGLYRDDDHKASAAVVVNLLPGRGLGERELQGIRHLVSSAVPGLLPEAVTVVDGSGSVLSTDGDVGSGETAYQRKMERDLEMRITGILEPVVGAGGVVPKVTVSLDAAEVHRNAEIFDPDQTALRSERKVASNQTQDQNTGGGVAGAAANQPLAPAASANAAGGSRSGATAQDEIRNFEVSHTTTTSVERVPRLQRLSVAILLDGIDGKPRSAPEIARLGELAKRAVGFDEERGDQLNISSSVFSRSAEEALAPPAALAAFPSRLQVIIAAAGLGLLVLAALVILLTRRRTARQSNLAMLRPGARVGNLQESRGVVTVEDAINSVPLGLPPVAPVAALPDPSIGLRDRARELAAVDPVKAAHLLRAWIATDVDTVEVKSG